MKHFSLFTQCSLLFRSKITEIWELRESSELADFQFLTHFISTCSIPTYPYLCLAIFKLSIYKFIINFMHFILPEYYSIIAPLTIMYIYPLPICLSVLFSNTFYDFLSFTSLLTWMLIYSFHTFFHRQTKDRSPHQILIRWLIWFTYSCQVIFIIAFVSFVDVTFQFQLSKIILYSIDFQISQRNIFALQVLVKFAINTKITFH